MAILAGHPAADALTWTPRHYRPLAVETPSQRRWISWFATHIRTSRPGRTQPTRLDPRDELSERDDSVVVAGTPWHTTTAELPSLCDAAPGASPL